MEKNINPVFNIRTGIGFDVHKFAPNRPLILGGIQLDYEMGLDGHSDADVLTHAIMDALLGAANLGDIGKLFPDTDEAYKGADSINLLKKVIERLSEKGFKVINIDTVICLEKPKIAPYSEAIKQNLANALGIDQSRVSIKATTTEKLGFVGRQEGASVLATALLYKD